ncbi:HAD-IIB family hydrolase [bacterium]|nr:HAD-IIB family hydrolase [bacterium]
MKQVVLFDMDGTLTPPRKQITREMVRKLKDLSKIADIGIVTGSGYDYLISQCKELWYDIGTVSPSSITLLPCNGTQVYTSKYGKFSLKHKADMRKELGSESLDTIMRCLMYMQWSHMCKEPPHSYTGHFVSYRESLINWCPVGRNANDHQRKEFIKFDKESNCRATAKDMIQKYLMVHDIDNVTLALGGSTSIDIFPTGWDKTYALQHFTDKDCWFVGDSCTGDGNDRTLYEALLPSGKSYETTSLSNTIDIVNDIIVKIKGDT